MKVSRSPVTFIVTRVGEIVLVIGGCVALSEQVHSKACAGSFYGRITLSEQVHSAVGAGSELSSVTYKHVNKTNSWFL